MNNPIIKPTVGRVVWFYPGKDVPFNGTIINSEQPMAATVAFVHSDSMVNLQVIDHAGFTWGIGSVLLVQDGPRPVCGQYCDWMPYQKGQAAKTEAAEKTASSASSEYRQPSQREQLEYALVSGAASHLAQQPHQAGQIAQGVKSVLDALHPDKAIKTAAISLPVIDPGPDPIEREIQAKGLTAPRVTPADIEAEIVSVHYFAASDAIQHENAVHEHQNGWLLGNTQLLTFCVIQLRNGFTVTGESACASPENFNAEIGRRIARQNAVEKIWPLLGFRLRDELARPVLTEADAAADLAGEQRPSAT